MEIDENEIEIGINFIIKKTGICGTHFRIKIKDLDILDATIKINRKHYLISDRFSNTAKFNLIQFINNTLINEYKIDKYYYLLVNHTDLMFSKDTYIALEGDNEDQVSKYYDDYYYPNWEVVLKGNWKDIYQVSKEKALENGDIIIQL